MRETEARQSNGWPPSASANFEFHDDKEIRESHPRRDFTGKSSHRRKMTGAFPCHSSIKKGHYHPTGSDLRGRLRGGSIHF